jgi:hypothetical protein
MAGQAYSMESPDGDRRSAPVGRSEPGASSKAVSRVHRGVIEGSRGSASRTSRVTPTTVRIERLEGRHRGASRHEGLHQGRASRGVEARGQPWASRALSGRRGSVEGTSTRTSKVC